ncbi:MULTISPECIES: SpoIIE family protein phosphatase [unclassified Pseudodesulfovibrio]|uniref:SpoIIE family protein phosphatase n=1 Tax=unclassified Pseudodesulfovibrio TaxID=2661612 RepID=UPI000FEBEBED|nr:MULTISPECIES: SpoIIE family protein phosphatase [unclassified Pseudodesulfovibrio]MCJ2164832.1 SpoIIE family protein phosphatase [Pseudodesulfovibrio sp. S3-i]RWU03799.1 HAMP domain-containing protein [Pseudodesulfovibrio sp. S3]
MKRYPIAFKLTFFILSCAFIIVAAIVVYNYTYSRDIILRQAEDNSRMLANETVVRIDSVLSSAQKVAENIAFSLEDASLSKEEIIELNRRVLANNPDIYGMAIAFEPYFLQPNKLYFAPYYFRTGGRLGYTMLGDPGYRYFYMDWYQLPKELGRPVWTEPYFDEGGGGVLMATYSVPFYRTVENKTVFAGVVTADISLNWLQEMVRSIRLYETGYAFMLSRHGTFITHPDRRLVMNQTMFSLAEELGSERLRKLGQSMLKGESNFVSVDDIDGRDSFLFSAGLKHGGWSLGIIFPKEEMLADVYRLSKVMTIIGVMGFVILVLVTIGIARRITHPLRELSGAAREIASGNLDLMLPDIKANDEVGDLAESFRHMKTSLKDFIRDLTATTSAKERIESELRIASEIQMGILPKLFPAFPDRKEFEVFASIEPAKEVGGDLYDFFFVDDTHFCFLVGDVSGKGVPAAFFMAVTKTLLKVVSEKGLDPGEILTKVNGDLSEDNESCMFVTLFLAIIDIETGETRYANAGHNPPIYMPCGGTPEWIPPFGEPVAGIMDSMEYSTKTMTMNPGDIIFIYTDGVTEAMDPDKTLYSEDRLMKLLTGMEEPFAPKLVKEIGKSIKTFTRGAEPSDDITMLAMQFMGSCKK